MNFVADTIGTRIVAKWADAVIPCEELMVDFIGRWQMEWPLSRMSLFMADGLATGGRLV